MEREGSKKVHSIFDKEGVISDAKFNGYMQKLRSASEGDSNWPDIYYGIKR
jgi:hypothetical protein